MFALLHYKMRVFTDLEILTSIKNPVVTIGTFDGVHLGHQKIIEQLNSIAKKVGGESVLFTFHPHPRMVLYPDSHGVKLLQTQEEKQDKLERTGLQNIILYPFTTEFSRLTAFEFVRNILVNKINVKHVVIGYDHHFGKNREGTITYLKEMGEIFDFDVTEINVKQIDEVNVSSTKIRNALKDGEVEVANSYLDEHYFLKGKVIHGNGLGKTIGFPTANLLPESNLKIIPKTGVYAVKVELADGIEHLGMMNIGLNPTMNQQNENSLEVHLLDFKDDLYSQEMTVHFLKRLRDEQKFSSTEALIEQLKQDEKDTRSINITN